MINNLRYKVVTDTVSRRMGNEVVLINLKTDKIFSLNRTAARFWELLSAGHSLSEIENLILQEYDVDRAQLAAEIEDLITSLREQNFITLYDEP